MNDWHLSHLGARALGGAGLIMVEATAVSPNARITPYDLGLWSDQHIEPAKRINRFLQANGAVVGVQLAHAGRKSSCKRPWEGGAHLGLADGGWPIVGPSPIAFGGKLARRPASLEPSEIAQIVEDFVQAAKRACEAGYQVLEIHAAHGYLLHSFYSPISNQRTDDYGGPFSHRIRFLCEVVTRVREIWPATLPLAVRLSCTDWCAGGWDLADTLKLCHILKDLGVDLIDCSSGFVQDGITIPFGANFQVPFSQAVKAHTGLATSAVGFINQAYQADAIIRNEQADFIFLARTSLRNPNWPLDAAHMLNETIEIPKPYALAWR